jgi:hypothetical protein
MALSSPPEYQIGSNNKAEYPAINDMFTLGSWQQANLSLPLRLTERDWLRYAMT